MKSVRHPSSPCVARDQRHGRHLGFAAVALAEASLLLGCAAGPDFVSPAQPDVAQYTAQALPTSTASAATALGSSQHFSAQADTQARWWRTFGSPRLDTLIEQALAANPALASAQARLRQAEETHAAQAGSTLYPRLQAGAGAQRQQPGVAGMSLPGTQQAPAATQYNLTLGAHYRLDLSGGNRRALEALAARADHQRFEFESARLALAGSIFATAVEQARLAGQIAVTEEIAKAQEEQVMLAGERVRLGHAAPREVMALTTQLEQSRASLPALRKQHVQTVHRLAVLAGVPPAASDLPRFTLEDFVLPSDLPHVLPSALVQRRPDIRAAEALMHAANAEYGVAVASMYPQVDLSASLGTQALSAGSLFGGGSAVWALIAQLTQPLFDAGLPARKRASMAAFEAAAANYRSVVLESLREVADLLKSLEHDAQALRAYAVASEAARDALQTTRAQHRLGAASYLELLVASEQWHQTRLQVLSAQGQRLLATAALYRAIGGGLA